MIKPLVHKTCLLEKFPGKGGWTFTRIPEIKPDKHAPFGWVKVKGSIDGYEIKQYHLMPMGDGQLFLPVKAAIRKVIKKEAGDWVDVLLHLDLDEEISLHDVMQCLADEPLAQKQFLKLSQKERDNLIQFIFASQKTSTRIERISSLIQTLKQRV